MDIQKQKDGIFVRFKEDFILSQTLECGQCFRFKKLKEEKYTVIAKNNVVVAEKRQNGIFFSCSFEEFEQFWKHYFDLETDYQKLKMTLKQKDEVLQQAIEFGGGIRILNQDFFECLISFIISQNNHIPRIKSIIQTLSASYGTPIANSCDYAFPTIEQLKNVTAKQLREQCKTGFRAEYIVDAVQRIASGEIKESQIKKLSTDTLRKKLMEIKGVGPKVADCVMLFSCGRKEVFPADVWINRIMTNLYFHGETVKPAQIQKEAADRFGVQAGLAQQYLFYYAHENGIRE